MSANHVIELIPAYALSCLDSQDMHLVSAHLEVCQACADELYAYQKVVAQLPLGAPESSPPADLKAKILAKLPGSGTAAQEKLSWWQTLNQRLGQLPLALNFASLALVIVLAASNLFLWQRVNTLSRSPESHFITVALQGTSLNPNATALLVMDSHGHSGTLVVDGLSDLEPSKTYQLWLIRDGQRSSGGTFQVDAEGYGSLWVSSELPLTTFNAFGVTIEPAGGSPGPTGERVLGGEL